MDEEGDFCGELGKALVLVVGLVVDLLALLEGLDEFLAM